MTVVVKRCTVFIQKRMTREIIDSFEESNGIVSSLLSIGWNIAFGESCSSLCFNTFPVDAKKKSSIASHQSTERAHRVVDLQEFCLTYRRVVSVFKC